MRTRIVLGAGAWLLGASAATAGGLYVVSELGHGISASPTSQQSNLAAAAQAQASQEATPSSSRFPRSTSRKSGTAGTGGTVLSSSGGTVVAQCATAGAFLLSWSPQQGFTATSRSEERRVGKECRS